MALDLLRELLEIAPLAFTEPSPDQLTNNATFQKVAKMVPEYAKKLMFAWNGDVKAYQQAHGKTADYLFLQTATPQALQKFATGVSVSPAWVEALKQLQALHMESFPQLSGNTDNSVWADQAKFTK